MDLALCQLRPKYGEALSEFNRLYEHKTRILRDYRNKPEMLDVLDEFSLNMARRGAELIRYRPPGARRQGARPRRYTGTYRAETKGST
jgi:DNA replication and repair protein RecF